MFPGMVFSKWTFLMVQNESFLIFPGHHRNWFPFKDYVFRRPHGKWSYLSADVHSSPKLVLSPSTWAVAWISSREHRDTDVPLDTFELSYVSSPFTLKVLKSWSFKKWKMAHWDYFHSLNTFTLRFTTFAWISFSLPSPSPKEPKKNYYAIFSKWAK